MLREEIGRRLKIKSVKETQTSKTTEHINVTNLEPDKRRSIFVDGMKRNGFAGFIKDKQDNQTYYIFIYEKASA